MSSRKEALFTFNGWIIATIKDGKDIKNIAAKYVPNADIISDSFCIAATQFRERSAYGNHSEAYHKFADSYNPCDIYRRMHKQICPANKSAKSNSYPEYILGDIIVFLS